MRQSKNGSKKVSSKLIKILYLLMLGSFRSVPGCLFFVTAHRLLLCLVKLKRDMLRHMRITQSKSASGTANSKRKKEHPMKKLILGAVILTAFGASSLYAQSSATTATSGSARVLGKIQ